MASITRIADTGHMVGYGVHFLTVTNRTQDCTRETGCPSGTRVYHIV